MYSISNASAEIRQALATGTYRIDPERLAEKFHRFNTNL